MGIIKAAAGAIGGALADQWLETIEPADMDNSILATYGTLVRKNDRRSSNRRRTEDVISNGSIIHVPENVYMLLVDGGKIISATDEPGYWQVDNSRAPSIFFKSDEGSELPGYHNTGRSVIKRPGGLVNTLKDSWERFKFGGTTPVKQQVVYINKQEIPDIRFGTKNPVPYTDRVLVPGRVVPCKVTSFGSYSIKVGDPLLFYVEICSKAGKSTLNVSDLAEQYLNEFLMAYTTALAKLSNDMVMVSDIPVKTMELGQYMADVLDKEWLSKRGFYIQSVGIAGISFDEKTDQLLEQYARDSILMDPNARAARMTGSIASGLEAAGSNEGGAMLGFAGMTMGMQTAGALGVMPGQQITGQQPPQQGNQGMQGQQSPALSVWTCSCGNKMAEDSRFCSNCGNKKPEPKNNEKTWNCTCGRTSDGLFCPNCGKRRPDDGKWTCSNCGNVSDGNFCSGCGNKKPQDGDMKE
ncbi:MAG: SPFH domain-containing protein [Caldicoprobacterales bacterium]|jgi:membrane protease subunit (stomatin/prohibitin family)